MQKTQKNIDAMRASSGKVQKALLEKRAYPVRSHINLSDEERSILVTDIKNHLTREQQRGILPIVQDHINSNKNIPQQFQFDLDKLSAEQLARLTDYVKNCIASNHRKQRRSDNEKRRKMAKAEPIEDVTMVDANQQQLLTPL